MLNTSNLNTTNSTIKAVIDSWYQNNLLNTTYESLIDPNSIFCNDRRVTNFGGWNPEGVTASDNGSYRLEFVGYSNKSLNCVRLLDAFGKNNSSAHLAYSIGLMSYPEMKILVNDKYYYNSSSAVRKSPGNYWLGTPSEFAERYGFPIYIYNDGSVMENYSSGNALSVRPAIVLNSNAEFSSGTGSTSDPWIVKGSEMSP